MTSLPATQMSDTYDSAIYVEDVSSEEDADNAMNTDGMLRDLEHIKAPPPVDDERLGKTADAGEFFDQPYNGSSSKTGRPQRLRDCRICR